MKPVPKLRFKEFDNNWSVHSMDDIVDVIDCKHRTPKYIEEGVPVVSPGSIKWGVIDLVSPIKRVTEQEYESLMDHCSPKEGDLVFSRNQSIGVASIISKESKFVLGQDTVLMQAKRVNPIFYYFRLQTNLFQLQISKVSGGSTFSRINLLDLRKLKVVISDNKSEQQKIGSFLTAVDEKIQQLRRKLELLEKYKKGIMEQLFSGKLRFKDDNGRKYPEWEEKRLEELFEAFKGKGLSKEKIETGGRHECILYGELYTIYKELVKEVVSKTNSNEGELSKIGDLLIPSSTTTIGIDLANVTALNRKNVLLGGDITILRAKEKVSNIFYAYYLSNFKKYEIASYAQGTTIVHLYYNHFKSMKLYMPVFNEQEKIANYLSALDAKMESVTAQIDQIQTFKKGLLQQMFV